MIFLLFLFYLKNIIYLINIIILYTFIISNSIRMSIQNNVLCLVKNKNIIFNFTSRYTMSL